MCIASYVTTYTNVIPIITAQQFENVLNSVSPAIIKFYQQGCPPCNTIKPLYLQASKRFSSISFYEMNADTPEVKARYKELQKELHMYGVPQCLFISDGNPRLSPEGSIRNTKEDFSNNLNQQIEQQFNITTMPKQNKKNTQATTKKSSTKKRKRKKKTKQHSCSDSTCNL